MGKLSAVFVRQVTAPGRYQDGDGLMLVVQPSGAKSWILRAQKSGRRRDFGIGTTKLVSLSDARDAAATMRRQIRDGLDPSAERRKVGMTTPTFKEMAALLHAEHHPAWRNEKHQRQWLRTVEVYLFPELGGLPIDEVESNHLRDAVAPIWLSKPETARRVLQRGAAVLDFAAAKGLRDDEAQLRAIRRGLPRQPRRDGRFRALPHSQVPNLIERLRERDNVSRVALEFLILTAARSGEVRGARWSEVSLEGCVWTVPAHRMKAGRTHAIPLSEAALSVLARAQRFRLATSDLIFPGLRSSAPMSDMTLLKLLRDMQVDSTVHGFRSAFRTWVAEETDWPAEVAEAALAHLVPDAVERAYKRTDFFDKRRHLMEDWSRFCLNETPPA